MVRAQVGDTDASMGKKVRTHLTRKAPVRLIAAAREAAQGTVTVRRYGSQQQQAPGVVADG